ncbi:hypothetical protein SBA1_340003 [Candidatus Sulfotelmatobacter kueseliae]|uniref:Uncharacterized protein n=1 Tax=Candidatus Sulfotelmatobacter kueseliae TaxID=2042962 RepID=A0A2U3KMT3_9BACT|nr:hypothetical protein SBA1_340003 [Candidatus Sulfotelmatobacter kueseliae]
MRHYYGTNAGIVSAIAWLRQPSPIKLVMGTDSNSSAIWKSLIDT